MIELWKKIGHEEFKKSPSERAENVRDAFTKFWYRRVMWTV